MIELYKTSKTEIDSLYKQLSNENKEYVKHFTPFKDFDEFYNNVINTENIFNTIKFRKKIIGFVMLRGKSTKQKRLGIYVQSQFANQGYGKIAIELFLNNLKLGAYKIDKVYLKVSKNNISAKKLYKKLGFLIEYEEGNDYIMSIQL